MPNMRNFFSNLSQRIAQSMQGRNGMDTLARVALGAAIVFLFINVFLGNFIFSLLSLVCILYCLFRVLSRNTEARERENDGFTSWFGRIRRSFTRLRNRWTNRDTTKYFKCSKCGQSLSVPRNKGTLRVTCPKCHTTTTIKS